MQTTRAYAYEFWMKAPNPMRKGQKFNMLLDWCIGKAAAQIKEFHMLPVGDVLLQYDTIAVNTIVKNKTGEVSSCDILYYLVTGT